MRHTRQRGGTKPNGSRRPIEAADVAAYAEAHGLTPPQADAALAERGVAFDTDIGTVYLIRCDETCWYKVGFTSNGGGARLQTLQTSCPYLLVELDARVGTVHDEQEIHSRHHRVRGLGEWFWFDSPEEARQAVAHLPPRTAYEVAVNRRAIAHASVLGGLEALEWSGEAGA